MGESDPTGHIARSSLRGAGLKFAFHKNNGSNGSKAHGTDRYFLPSISSYHEPYSAHDPHFGSDVALKALACVRVSYFSSTLPTFASGGCSRALIRKGFQPLVKQIFSGTCIQDAEAGVYPSKTTSP